MTKNKCLIKGCEGKQMTRGLCSKCYTTARKLVETGQTTWEVLKKKGLVYEKRTNLSPFMDEFNKIKQ